MNTKMLTSTAIAAVFALGTSGAMAAGLNASSGVNANAGVSTGVDSSAGMKAGTSMDASGSAAMGTSTDRNYTWNRFVSKMELGSNAKIKSVNDPSAVQIVDVATLDGGANGSADLRTLVHDNKTNVDTLQAEVRGNTTVQNKLKAQGLKTANVVAADTAADGTLVLFVSKNV